MMRIGDPTIVDGELLAVQPYQNTLGAASSTIRYLTIDGGYNLFVGPRYRLSPFVGYSHFSQGMNDFNTLHLEFVPPLQGPPARAFYNLARGTRCVSAPPPT